MALEPCDDWRLSSGNDKREIEDKTSNLNQDNLAC